MNEDQNWIQKLNGIKCLGIKLKKKASTSIKSKTISNKNNKDQIKNINKKENFCIFSRRKETNEGRKEKNPPKPC
jgi:hypothetical protein